MLINDIIFELVNQLWRFKHHAVNAKIFLELSNKLKELELSIYVYESDNSNDEKKKINDTISAIIEEIELRQSEFEEAVKKYEFSQEQIASLDETINTLRDELLNLTVALEKQNGEIKLYNEKISIAKEQNERTLDNIKQCEILVDNAKTEKENLEKEHSDVEENIKQSELSQKNLEVEYKTTLEKLSLGEANAENVDSALFMALEESGDIKSRMLKYETELESLKSRQKELFDQKEALENDNKNFDYKIENAELEIEKIENKIEEKNDQKSDIEDKIAKLNESYDELSDKIDEARVDYHTKLSKYNVLSEMKEYNEGFAISVRRLLEQAHDGSSIGGKIVGVVASLMRVPAKYEVAIEMALGASVQNIVTKNEEDAKSLIDYLKTNKFGRVTFLPITSVKERSISPLAQSKLNMKGVCGIASELIDYDSKYDRVFNSLLGSTIIIDNMDNAIAFSRATGYSTKIVTLDGDVISPQGSLTGGSRKENSANILGRDREIEELKKDLETLKQNVDNFGKKQEEIRALIAA